MKSARRWVSAYRVITARGEMLAKRHKLMADVTAIRYADGAAIKDSFGILQRATFHQQIIARLWRFLSSEGVAKMYRHLRLCC